MIISNNFNSAFKRRNEYLSTLSVPQESVGFSFLTTVYKYTNSDFFLKTADAVRQQSYKNYEWIILRHGEISECLNHILQSLEKDNRIHVYSLEQNIGILSGMAFCLDKATKKYVIPLDSDDLIVPETLAVLTRYILTHTICDFFYSDEAMLINDVLHPYFRGEFDPLINFSASYIWHLMAFKRETAQELGVYTNKKTEYCHDWDTVTRFFVNNKIIKHIPEVLYLWRQHDRSTSNSGKEYNLAGDSQRETLKFALQTLECADCFSIEEFPIFRGTVEYRCRWNKGWPNKPFLFLLNDSQTKSSRHLDSFLLEASIPHEHVHVIKTSTSDNGLFVLKLKNALEDLPSDAWCWIIDDRLIPQGRWLQEETASWFTLNPALDFLCGNIIDSQGIILDGGAMFSFNGLLGSPEAGSHVNEPGYFSIKLRAHYVDAPNSFFFGARVRALLSVLKTMPNDTGINSLGLYVGIHCRLNEKFIGWSPLIQAKKTSPFPTSMINNIDFKELKTKYESILNSSKFYSDVFSKIATHGWKHIYQYDSTSNSCIQHKKCVSFKELLRHKAPRLFATLKLSKNFLVDIKKIVASENTNTILPISMNDNTPTEQFSDRLTFSVYPAFPINKNFTTDIRVKEILPTSFCSRLVVILPGIRSNAFSGGPNTALLLAAEIAKAGHDVLSLSIEDNVCSTMTLQKHLIEGLKLPPEVAAKFSASRYEDATVHCNDKILATRYDTAFVAKTLASKLNCKRFAYLLQDFEPMLFPWNEDHALAAASYATDFLPIINEPLLAEFFMNSHIGCFAEPDFRKNILAFSPAVDRTYFYPQAKPDGKRILLFYARPYSAPRNLTNLGLEALSILVERNIINAEEWEVLTMGEPSYTDIPLGKGMKTKNLAWMDFKTYTKCVRSSTIGLSLMLSPHTSYLPLEFAACGIPVVTSCYANKTPHALKAISPCIIGSALDPEAIAQNLEKAIQQSAENYTIEAAKMLSLPVSWEIAFSSVMPTFLAFMSDIKN